MNTSISARRIAAVLRRASGAAILAALVLTLGSCPEMLQTPLLEEVERIVEEGGTGPTYTVTYDANGATSGTVPVDPLRYAAGQSVTALSNSGNLMKTGEVFIGWNTQATGGGNHYDVGEPFNMGSSDVTLYAQWTTVTTYTLSYHANGATGGTVPPPSQHPAGTTVTVSANTGGLSRTGYTLAGWNDLASGTGFTYTPGVDTLTMPADDKTVYAKWVSTNANLLALTVSVGTLSPAFAAGTTAYSVSVPYTTTSITVTGTKADPNATLSANSGVAQSLNVGTNTISITVTAQDGTTTKNYVVTVNRAAASTNANLSALTVSAGTLSPAFAAGTTAYSLSVPNATTSITVTGTKADSNATLSANNGVAQALSVGANTITITVTAQDGATTKNYVVTVTRRAFDLTMVNVPAGRFQRDATASNISVITQAYRVSQHEITRSQFSAVMGSDPSNTTYSSGDSDPVQRVNWYHAIAFCNKLSLAEGLTPVYAVSGVDFNTLTYASIPAGSNATWNAATATWNNNGYRLPTEMEFMWAAMGAPADGQGGGTNTTGYLKAFAGSTGSNSIGDYAWYNGNSSTKTHPAGTKTVNELGLYDMSGNVMEWCWDWFAAYPTGTLTDYRGAASGTNRVLRGGHWGSTAPGCAVAYRDVNTPSGVLSNDGFRVVRP